MEEVKGKRGFTLEEWPEIQKRLSEPFSQDQVEFRPGSTYEDRCLALAYVDVRIVRDRLIDVLGLNWQTEHYDCGAGRLGCKLSILVDGNWYSRSDGAGGTKVEAEKGAFSDATKRAAVSWEIGRYLYDFPDIWVPMLSKDKKKITEEGFKKLRNTYEKWASKGFARIAPEPIPEIDSTESEKVKTEFEKAINECKDLDELKAVANNIRGKKELMLKEDVLFLTKLYTEKKNSYAT